MRLPSEPVQLSIEQIKDLNQQLSTMRHDINNHLALIMAATELIRYKPDSVERMMETLSEQPTRISESVAKFSENFESTLKIKKI
jgi:gas vesicle protein